MEGENKLLVGQVEDLQQRVREQSGADQQIITMVIERQLFEAALDRMAREVAAVKKVDLGKAIEELESTLRKKTAAAAAAAAAAAS